MAKTLKDYFPMIQTRKEVLKEIEDMMRFVKCYFCLLTQFCSCRRLEAGFGGRWYKTLAAPQNGLRSVTRSP